VGTTEITGGKGRTVSLGCGASEAYAPGGLVGGWMDGWFDRSIDVWIS
jgi:hypothetical protein